MLLRLALTLSEYISKQTVMDELLYLPSLAAREVK